MKRSAEEMAQGEDGAALGQGEGEHAHKRMRVMPEQLEPLGSSSESDSGRAELTASTANVDMALVQNVEEEIDRLLKYKLVGPKVLRTVAQIEIKSPFLELVEEYEQWGRRKRFLWQWLDYGTRMMQLPSVRPELTEHALMAKNLANMLNVVTDDIGDEDHNCDLLQALNSILFRDGNRTPQESYEQRVARIHRIPMNERERRESKFCLDVLLAFKAAAAKLPRWNEMERVLRYDLMQMINEKFYSAMVNTSQYLMNTEEQALYGPHTMNAMIFCSIDLMASDDVKESDIGEMRAIFWNANLMANTANCIATWKREVKTRDFTSPIFPLAIEIGFVTKEQLDAMPVEEIVKAMEDNNIERELLRRWIGYANKIRKLGQKVSSMDVEEFIRKNEEFLELHLACSGHI